ncbi:MAG: alkaline phosphatase family protein [Bacteroidetes bacterium]|nr:alkaline phosphatase family protein [Bacteroidota bacterium]
MGNRISKRVLLIGWDGADWGLINPLLDAGKMPALEKLINKGVIGNIATLDPPISPVLWTSIATGKRADKHGILGFVEPNPDQGGIRPINVTSRKCKALWNIFHHEGMKSNVIGWWPSHPAEPINGTVVSNYYQKVDNSDEKKWFMPNGTISHEGSKKDLFNLRFHPSEITGDLLKPFVPLIEKINQDEDNRLLGIANILSQTISIHSASTWVMRNTEWDFMGIYLDAIDHVCHGFVKYISPKMDHISESDHEIYKDVVEGMYIFHDMMLERLVELAGEDTTIIITSDHGFYSDHRRMATLPKCNTAPTFEHNPFGMFLISGPGIKKDERVYGASLLDIAPTILALFGLPVGKDMDGKVLGTIFENEIKTDFIESWEKIDGDFGEHSEIDQEDTFESAEALRQLVELGYIEDPGEDKTLAALKAGYEAKYCIAKIQITRKNFTEALSSFEELYHIDKTDIRYNLELLRLNLHLQKFKEAKEILENLRTIPDAGFVHLSFYDGIIAFNEGDSIKALDFFKQAEKEGGGGSGIHNQMGMIYLQLQKYDEAIEAFSKELNEDENSYLAYYGLGVSQLHLNIFEDAADNLLNSIGLIYSYPPSHYYLGVALYHLERFQDAANAFELFLKLAPTNLRAHKWLSKIYGVHLLDKNKQIINQNYSQQLMKGQVIIVSGLPRSGTSMMMQILEKGGISIFTDEQRIADQSNPKGYYEHAAVKRLSKDNTCIIDANGKAVKVIAQLLQFLPDNIDYKIIFMHRDINEIMSSQQKMLGKDPSIFPFAIAEAFKKELSRLEKWFKLQSNIELLDINYSDVIANPEIEILKTAKFLEDFNPNIPEMISAVDKELYRSKKI